MYAIDTAGIWLAISYSECLTLSSKTINMLSLRLMIGSIGPIVYVLSGLMLSFLLLEMYVFMKYNFCYLVFAPYVEGSHRELPSLRLLRLASVKVWDSLHLLCAKTSKLCVWKIYYVPFCDLLTVKKLHFTKMTSVHFSWSCLRISPWLDWWLQGALSVFGSVFMEGESGLCVFCLLIVSLYKATLYLLITVPLP